jgi:hypothetical protein
MNQYGRFKATRRGGSYLPRMVDSGAWADNALAADPTLPHAYAFRWGLICAHALHQNPLSQGHWNHLNSDTDRALWQQGFDRGQSLIAHLGA